jgi:hypothetical protein
LVSYVKIVLSIEFRRERFTFGYFVCHVSSLVLHIRFGLGPPPESVLLNIHIRLLRIDAHRRYPESLINRIELVSPSHEARRAIPLPRKTRVGARSIMIDRPEAAA